MLLATACPAHLQTKPCVNQQEQRYLVKTFSYWSTKKVWYVNMLGRLWPRSSGLPPLRSIPAPRMSGEIQFMDYICYLLANEGSFQIKYGQWLSDVILQLQPASCKTVVAPQHLYTLHVRLLYLQLQTKYFVFCYLLHCSHRSVSSSSVFSLPTFNTANLSTALANWSLKGHKIQKLRNTTSQPPC